MSDDQLANRFLAVDTPRELANLLKVPYKKLVYHIYKVDDADKYERFSLSKTHGGVRTIRVPVTALKLVQEKLSKVLQAVYEPRESTHGFVPGRSIVTNARQHTRKRWVLNVDIEAFFPSINFGRVYGLFQAYPYSLNQRVAAVLAQICCHENELPQGAPTSPVVSNMICAKLDSELQQLAGRYRCTYSRYADDMAFSTSEEDFPEEMARDRPYPATPECELGSPLRRVIVDNGFEVNEDKLRLRRYDQRQVVTGLKVNQKPNVHKSFISQIRAMLHAWDKYGEDAAEREFFEEYDDKHRHPDFDEPSFRRVVWGKIQFLKMVKGPDDSKYQKYLRQYHQLVGRRTEDAVWLLFDEDEIQQGTAFALRGVGLVTAAHVLTDNMVAFRPEYPDEKYSITVHAQSRSLDIAVVDCESDGHHELTVGNPETVQQGDEVDVFGFPNWDFGDPVHRYSTHVAARVRRHATDHFQLGSGIFPGISGGPVVDSAGEVIAIALRGPSSHDEAPTYEPRAIGVRSLNRIVDLAPE